MSFVYWQCQSLNIQSFFEQLSGYPCCGFHADPGFVMQKEMEADKVARRETEYMLRLIEARESTENEHEG